MTRWNSALEIINSLLSLRNEVQEALKRTGNFDLLLKTVEWNTLKQLSIFLDLFKSLTEICRGNSVGLSVVQLIRAKVAAACITSDSDCAELALLKRKKNFGTTGCSFSTEQLHNNCNSFRSCILVLAMSFFKFFS